MLYAIRKPVKIFHSLTVYDNIYIPCTICTSLYHRKHNNQTVQRFILRKKFWQAKWQPATWQKNLVAGMPRECNWILIDYWRVCNLSQFSHKSIIQDIKDTWDFIWHKLYVCIIKLNHYFMQGITFHEHRGSHIQFSLSTRTVSYLYSIL